MLIFLAMMISTSLHNLMRTVYLLDEDKEGEGMRHDEVGDFDSLVWDICEELEVDTIAATDDEGDIFALVPGVFEHISKGMSAQARSALIEEDNRSFRLLQGLDKEECLLHLDVFRVGV